MSSGSYIQSVVSSAIRTYLQPLGNNQESILFGVLWDSLDQHLEREFLMPGIDVLLHCPCILGASIVIPSVITSFKLYVHMYTHKLICMVCNFR